MTATNSLSTPSVFRQFYALTKPRVIQLIVFCALIGMVLAVPGMPALSQVGLAAVACHERDLAEVTRILPIGVISATVDGFGCVAIPDPGGPGRYRQISNSLAGRTCAMGPAVGPNRLAESWQLARFSFDAAQAGAVPGEGLIRAEDHLVDLALFRSRDLISRLRDQTMAPIGDLTPKARKRMAETALAYVENAGNAAEMARSLNIHPQTARYRIARLREHFGDDLDLPDRRLALELSLRSR